MSNEEKNNTSIVTPREKSIITDILVFLIGSIIFLIGGSLGYHKGYDKGYNKGVSDTQKTEIHHNP